MFLPEAPGYGGNVSPQQVGLWLSSLAWSGWEGQPVPSTCRFFLSGFLVRRGQEVHSTVNWGGIQHPCLGADRLGSRPGKSLHLRQADLHSTEFPSEAALSWFCRWILPLGNGITTWVLLQGVGLPRSYCYFLRAPSPFFITQMPSGWSPQIVLQSPGDETETTDKMWCLLWAFLPLKKPRHRGTSRRGAVPAKGEGGTLPMWLVLVSAVEGRYFSLTLIWDS